MGQWAAGRIGCTGDEGIGDADTGWIGGGFLSSAGRNTFLQKAFVLRCVSSQIYHLPHLGHGSFLTLPLVFLAKVP